MSRYLDPRWEAVPYHAVAEILVDLTHDVVVIVEPDLSDPAFQSCMNLYADRVGYVSTVVICTLLSAQNMVSLARSPSIQVVVIGQDDPRALRSAVDRAREERMFPEIIRRVHSLPGASPILVRAMKRAIMQAPRSCEEACEILASGGVVYVRTVTALAAAFGCHPGYLTKAAAATGVGLGKFLRWVTFLCGMKLRNETLAPWTEIALRLGFSSLPAWTHFTKRLVGISPTEAERLGIEDWEGRCIESIFGVGR